MWVANRNFETTSRQSSLDVDLSSHFSSVMDCEILRRYKEVWTWWMRKGGSSRGLYKAAVKRLSSMSAYACGFNWSMQHLISNDREGDVENEATTKDLLHRRAKGVDVGSLAEGLIPRLDCSVV